MTLISLWQDRHRRTPDPRGQRRRRLGRRRGRRRHHRADHRPAARPRRPVGGPARGRPRRLRHHRPQHRQAQPAPGHPAVPDRPPALRATVVRHYVRGQRRGAGLGRAVLRDPRRRVQHRPAYTFATSSKRRPRGPHGSTTSPAEAGLPVTWLDRLDLPFETRGGVRLPGPAAARPAGAARRAVAAGRRARRTHRRARARAQGHRPRAGHGRHRRRHGARPAPSCSRRTRRSSTGAASSPASSRRGPTAWPSGRRSRRSTGCTSPRTSPAGRSATPPTRTASLLLVGGNGHTTGRGGSEAARIEELRAWTHGALPAGRGDARVVGPGLRAASRAAVRRPAAAGLRRICWSPAATRSGA